jgi:preprotein translocase subunit SecE
VSPEPAPLSANSVQLFRKVPEFFQQVKAEVKRVTWPSRRELTMTTAMVFLMVLVVALFFFFVDEAIIFARRVVFGF